MAYFNQYCKSKILSQSITEALLGIVNRANLKSSAGVWKIFVEWLNCKIIRSDLPPYLICEFLFSKFISASSASSVNTMRTGTSFQILLVGGECNRISGRIFYRIFKRLKTCRPHHTPPPPPHVLANLNGIVILPEYILTNSHFLLEKNEIVIEPIEKAYGRKSFEP